MITILGAGGAIGSELVQLLAATKQPFRLVGRNPKAAPGASETFAADVTDEDQTIRAVAGSSVVHLLVGLKYDHKLWEEMWPRVMSNAIEACQANSAESSGLPVPRTPTASERLPTPSSATNRFDVPIR